MKVYRTLVLKYRLSKEQYETVKKTLTRVQAFANLYARGYFKGYLGNFHGISFHFTKSLTYFSKSLLRSLCTKPKR